MNILISLNDKYVEYYIVQLISVCENNANVNVYVAHSESLSQNRIAYIQKSLDKYNARVTSCFISKQLLKDAPVGDWAIEMYNRLLIFAFIDTKVERILYLDGDTIVNKNIKEFYEQDFKGKCFVACEDIAITRGKNLEEYNSIGLDIANPYYNTGVLLIDLEYMRRNYDVKSIIEFILNNKQKLKFPDQSVLNSYFYNDILWQDGSIFNCQVGGYSYKDEKNILKNASILHFCGDGNRPWEYYYRHHFSSSVSPEIWWRYAKKSPYRKKYLQWKIINTILVVPWQIIYLFYRRWKR